MNYWSNEKKDTQPLHQKLFDQYGLTAVYHEAQPVVNFTTMVKQTACTILVGQIARSAIQQRDKPTTIHR